MKERKSTSRIVIHHSASPAEVKMEDIRRWHIQQGWEDIGYHFVIEKDGLIREGRSLMAVGAHAIGANYDSIGICLTGNFETTAPPTDAQIKSLVKLISKLRVKFGAILYQGHSEIDPLHPTACPGKLFPWKRLEVELVNIDQAIQVLKDNGVLQDVEYWTKAASVVKYLDNLLINMAGKF